MNGPANLTQPRLVLFGTGAASVALALWHFATRGELVGDATMAATYDLNGLSMLYAGLVTIAVAWMAGAPRLVAAYAILYAIYYAGHAWILGLGGISWNRAGIALLLAAASAGAAYLSWAAEDAEKAPSAEAIGIQRRAKGQQSSSKRH